MEDLFQRLEKQIKKLIDQSDQLKQANYQLNHGKSVLTREKDRLMLKQKKAALQIQSLLSKLKTLENLS